MGEHPPLIRKASRVVSMPEDEPVSPGIPYSSPLNVVQRFYSSLLMPRHFRFIPGPLPLFGTPPQIYIKKFSPFSN